MDNIRDLGKKLKEGFRESSHNVRRYSENFPKIERSVDKVGPANPYSATFTTSDHPHTVSLDFRVQPYNEECIIEPIETVAMCQTRCPQYPFGSGTSDGGYYPAHEATMEANIGGFQLDPDYGVIVPLSGIYQVHYTNNVVGVVLGTVCVRASIRHNDAIIAERVACNDCGFCFFSASFSFTATIVAAAGDNISSWQQAPTNLLNYTPSNFCWLEDTLGARGYMRIELMAEA